MAAPPLDLRTYLLLERSFVRRLQRSWQKMSAPIYAALAEDCRNRRWDRARQRVPDLDMAEVGTENREWIQYMLLSFAVFGAGTVSRKKPSFVGVGTFDTFLKQTTNNFLMYLEYRATAQVQAEALQSIAEDEAKTKALKFDKDQLRDAKGRWTTGGLTTDQGNVYLHGTAQAFLDDILANGISGEHTGRIHTYDAMRPRLKGKSVGDPGHVYMTTDEAEARAYAESAAVEISYGKNPIPPTLQDIVYSVEVPESERKALAWESGTEVGGGMPCVVTVTLPPHIVRQLRKDKKSDILTPWNRATPKRSKVARSYKGTIKPEWITSISYQTRDIATGVETWHTIKPSEWKAPPPTRLPHQPKVAAEGQTFYIPLVIPLPVQKFDEAKHPRDAKGQFAETYHGTSVKAAQSILEHGILPVSEGGEAPPGFEGYFTRFEGAGKGKAFVSSSEKVAISYAASRSDDEDDLIAVVVLKPEAARMFENLGRGQEALRKHPGSWGSASATEMASDEGVPPHLIQEVRIYRNGDVQKAFAHPYGDWLTPLHGEVEPVTVMRRGGVTKQDAPLFVAFVLPKPAKPVGIGGITKKFDASKHPRGDDGRFIEATAPRIFNKMTDVGQYDSWGEKKWGWRATQEDVRYGYTLGQVTGKLLTGEPIPRDQLPPTLYHVTTNAPAVEESGVLLGLLESGGLGGGQAQGVSFTTSKEDAHVIQRELRRAIQIARGDVDIDAIERWAREDEQEAGLTEGALTPSVKEAMYGWEGNQGSLTKTHVWDMTKPEGERHSIGPAPTGAEYDRIRRSLVKDAFNAYLMGREAAAARSLGNTGYPYNVPILKNPILFGQQEILAKLKPEDVGTIEVPSANIPEGALVTTGSDKFLHEVRTYSDVPVTNAIYHRRMKFDESKHVRHPKGSGEHGGEFKDSAMNAPVLQGVDTAGNVGRNVEKHLAKWEGLKGARPTAEDLQAAEAELRALPLVHGTSLMGAVGAASDGLKSFVDMQKNAAQLIAETDRLRLEIEEAWNLPDDWSNWTADDIEDSLGLPRREAEELAAKIQELVSLDQVLMGTTNPADTKLGLDQFVFMSHGKKHQDYGNVAVIIDNEVVQKGFATEKDIVVVPGGAELGKDGKWDHYNPRRIEAYQDMIVMGDDYYKVAAAHAGSAKFIDNRSREQLFEIKAPSVPKSAVKGFLVEGDIDTAQRLADKLAAKGIKDKVLYMEDSSYNAEHRKFLHEQLKYMQANGMWDEEAIVRWRDEHEGVYLL